MGCSDLMGAQSGRSVPQKGIARNLNSVYLPLVQIWWGDSPSKDPSHKSRFQMLLTISDWWRPNPSWLTDWLRGLPVLDVQHARMRHEQAHGGKARPEHR